MNPIFEAVVDFILDISGKWLEIVIAPFTTRELLWIIIPIYLSWWFNERYQELKKTSFGNAISNGVVTLWVGIDWIRMLVRILTEQGEEFSTLFAVKFVIAGLTLVYGFSIVYLALKTRKFVHYFGKIREVSYVMIMFSPMIYGAIDVTLYSVLAVFIYFPIFYLFIELINRLLPQPKTYQAEDEEDGKTPFSSSSGKSPFSDEPSSQGGFGQSFGEPSSSPQPNFSSSQGFQGGQPQGPGSPGPGQQPQPQQFHQPQGSRSPGPGQQPQPQPFHQPQGSRSPGPGQQPQPQPFHQPQGSGSPGPGQQPQPQQFHQPQGPRSHFQAPHQGPENLSGDPHQQGADGRPPPQQPGPWPGQQFQEQPQPPGQDEEKKKRSPFSDLPSFKDNI